MKHSISIIAAFAIAAIFTSCRVEAVRNSGKQQTKEYKVAPFTEICNVSAADITFMPSDSFKVKVTASEKVIGNMRISVKDGILTIEEKRAKNDDKHVYLYRSNDSNGASIIIQAPSLGGVNLIGSGDFMSKGKFCSNNFNISTIGSGDIELDTLDCNGTIEITSVGSGDVSGVINNAKELSVNTSGAGDVQVGINNVGTVKGVSNGSGDIIVKGKPKMSELHSAGSGQVKIE